MNHLGKLMFQWFYWHALLPGRDIPGIGADMPDHGKDHTRRPDREGGIDMSTTTYAGVAVELNDEGFFEDPNQWTREMAVEMAKADGIDELTEQHWTGARLHAQGVLREGHRPHGARARQDLRREREGPVRAVPEGPRQDGRAHRRHPEAEGLHLIMELPHRRHRADHEGLDHRLEGFARGHLPRR